MRSETRLAATILQRRLPLQIGVDVVWLIPMSNGNYGAVGKLLPVGIVLILLLVLFQASIVIVQSGHVGVVRMLGAVQPQPLPEGFHLKKPFLDLVEQVDIRLTATTADASAASRDLQIVSTKVTTQYSLNGEVAPETYQRVGDRNKVAVSVVEPAIQESVKAVTAKFTAEQLVTQREAVRTQIAEQINAFIEITLRDKELSGAVRISNVAITDFQFSGEFNRAIELKVKAEQEALQAKNEKLRRVTQAEAAAAEKKLEAEARAFQIEAESVARAEAIQREAESLRGNPELIQLRAVESWDGILPRFTGSNAIPFLNLESFDAGGDTTSTANRPLRRTIPSQ